MKKYYSVIAKCGHVGRNNYILKEFGVTAENGKDAALKARMIPRVKHDRKDAIIDVKELTRDEFVSLINKNDKDPYLKCKSKQEQKRTVSDFTNVHREKTVKDEYNRYERKQIARYKLLKETQKFNCACMY